MGIAERAKWLALTMTLASPGRVQAFIDPPRIVPAFPDERSDIHVEIRAGFCDSFLTLGPQDRELEIRGTTVIVRARGHSTTDFAQCNFYPGTFSYQIGQLRPGRYDFQIFQRGLFVPTQLTLVGTTKFTVGVSTAIPIPTGGACSTIGLIALLAGVTGAALRRQSQSSP